jgi:hypothetical protein
VSPHLRHTHEWLAEELGRLESGEIETVRRALDLLDLLVRSGTAAEPAAAA